MYNSLKSCNSNHHRFSCTIIGAEGSLMQIKLYIANCVFGQRKACPCSWNLRWILSIVKLEMMSMFVMFSSIMAKMALIETCPRDFIYLETNLYPSFYCKGLNITINDSNFPSINYFHKIDKNELIFLYTTNSGT